jgi:hypothetical protein
MDKLNDPPLLPSHNALDPSVAAPRTRRFSFTYAAVRMSAAVAT